MSFDLENSPLEIKTNSEFGSEESIYVLFEDTAVDGGDGYVVINFYAKPSSNVGYCKTKEFSLSDFPSTRNRIWRITFTKNSGT